MLGVSLKEIIYGLYYCYYSNIINALCRFVGGIDERTGDVFFQQVESRDQDTLASILVERIHPESIVVTDLWKGYNKVDEIFWHATVNHSKNFVDPETGHYTQTIEAIWSCIKRLLKDNGQRKEGWDDFYLLNTCFGGRPVERTFLVRCFV